MVPERALQELQQYYSNKPKAKLTEIKSLSVRHKNTQKHQNPGKPGSGYRHQGR